MTIETTTLTPIERIALDLMERGHGKRVGGECFDPQCGDNTWDHDCTLGSGELVPDLDLARAALAAVVNANVAVGLMWLPTLTRLDIDELMSGEVIHVDVPADPDENVPAMIVMVRTEHGQSVDA